ncbi:uncharacterized protein LOC118768969 isoform X2 [Megalops cyprinoides]|nr:uncharacterized protein LOC118768969 isoform X2 [Megalops cyprinoides]
MQDDFSIEVKPNDYLDIYCPHYPPGAPTSTPPETLALYLVREEEFRGCVETEGAVKRWECNHPYAPFGPVRFSEKIQRFTPFSMGFEFLPGRHYFYSSLATQDSPQLPCMKLKVTVCCQTSECSTPLFIPSPFPFHLLPPCTELVGGHPPLLSSLHPSLFPSQVTALCGCSQCAPLPFISSTPPPPSPSDVHLLSQSQGAGPCPVLLPGQNALRVLSYSCPFIHLPLHFPPSHFHKWGCFGNNDNSIPSPFFLPPSLLSLSAHVCGSPIHPSLQSDALEWCYSSHNQSCLV